MKKLLVSVSALSFLTAALLLYSFFPQSKTDDNSVRIESGLISGEQLSSGVIAYKGIPFAAPPVGALRWKPPQAVASWQGVRHCVEFGPSPMQSKPVPFMVYTREFLIPEKPISEDCLYLNVWTKAKKGEKKPVFVWIYGGGFVSGGAAVPIYDGEAMARKGIIFISVNYRVGVFGFLSHPALTRESPEKSSGNYGILDQVAGLKWIKKNIEAFGGDPENITIAGQSAGSMIANCLVASPLGKNLFQHVISESGSMLAYPAAGLHDAEEQGIRLASSVHAGNLEELRNMPAEAIMKFPARYMPVVDGWVLPAPVQEIFASGKQNPVPAIVGWNADEGYESGVKNKDDYLKEIREKYGSRSSEFLTYFPGNTDEEASASQFRYSRDMTFALSGYQWAKLQSVQGKSPIYVYYFSRKLPATAEFVKYGAFHTGEVAYVMDNLKFLHRPWEKDDQPLADLMSGYWARFMTEGTPNGGGLPAWPSFDTAKYQVMNFDKKSSVMELPDRAELEFLLTLKQ